MKFRMLVQVEGIADPDWETYDENIDDPQDWAEKTIVRFNDTLRPHERPRSLVRVEILDRHSVKDHRWGKTNLMTLSNAHGIYDRVECERCGIKALRYGLQRIVRQAPFRPKVYERCDSAMAHLAKKSTDEDIQND